MQKPLERKMTGQARHPRMKQERQEPIQEVVRAFLTHAQVSSRNVACLKCGSTSDLKQITASLFGTSDRWEISLPLCERCASQDGASPARSQYGFGSGVPIRGMMRVEPDHRSETRTASLVSEMNAIHSANAKYWERGGVVTLEARAEYHRRQGRLEEIRFVLANSRQLGKSDGSLDGAVGGVSGMNNEKWEELYLLAAKEVDGEKVPERVAAVREAIRGRLQDLQGDSDHHEERVYLKSALGNLDVLEAEAQNW